jgi:glycoside/pentoside/hexuronide:cation symporter, GPH family
MTDSAMPSPVVGAARTLPIPKGFAYSTGTIGMALFPTFLASWQLYFFSPPADSGRTIYASALIISIANLVAQLFHSFADGFIGHASDRTRTNWGRRIPWIFFSAPILSISFIAIWWPTTEGPSWMNVVWLVALRSVMWIAYTGVFGPYSSLLAELTTGRSRIITSVFMALFEVVGTILATAGAGEIIARMRDGATIGPFVLSDGFKVAAVLVGVIGLVAIWGSIAFVRERPHNPSKDVPYSLLEAVKQTLKNPAFRPYVMSLVVYRIALLAVLTLLPFQVNVVLQLDGAEAVAGTLQTVIVLGAVLLFPAVGWLSSRFSKRSVLLWGFFSFAAVMASSALVGKIPIGTAIVHAYVVYAFATFPVATLFVLCRPILADVIDHDEKLTGYRREGMYNGVEGMLTKVAEGVGPVVAASLFALFGSTRAEPLGVILVGPAAAVLCVIGGLIFRRYPLHT